MTEPQTELDWLGLEAALERHLFGVGNRALARILTRLARRAGLTCRFEDIYDGSSNSLRVRISLLREAMRDLGFSCRVETVSGCGYRLSEKGAGEVWGRVRDALAKAA